MNGLISTPADSADAERAAVVAVMVDNDGITRDASLAELHALCRELRGIVESADELIEHIGQLAGPSPGPMAAHLRTMAHMGAGYFRHNLAVIHAALKKRAELRAELEARP